MRITNGNTIRTECGALVMRTDDGRWSVSKNGTFIGYVDSLQEVNILIKRQEQGVRDRLARVEAEAARRKAEAEAERQRIEAATKPDE